LLHLPSLYILVGIMGKRVAPVTCAPAAKKEKVNPVNSVFVEIQDALSKADHLPVNVRAMLAAMVPMGFATPRMERSEQQDAVIQWMEDALMQERAKFVAEADDASDKLSQVEASKAERMEEVHRAETTLAEKKAVLPLKKHALAETTIGMSTTKKVLAEKQQEQQACDGEFLSMKKEQEGLAAAFVEHFKVPLDAGEELHYHELQPFLSKLDLEESFMVSIPASCCKTREQRGKFDEVVLQALEEALLKRATEIKDAVSNQSPESVAREASVCAAEEQLVKERESQARATAELAAAQKDVEVATTVLKEMEQLAANFDGELSLASEFSKKMRSVQESFEQGALTSFKTSKDGIVANCATAGA